MNSDATHKEEVRQGFLLSFCSGPVLSLPQASREHSLQHQSSASDASNFSSRSGMSSTFMAAADIASAFVEKASAELIDTPLE